MRLLVCVAIARRVTQACSRPRPLRLQHQFRSVIQPCLPSSLVSSPLVSSSPLVGLLSDRPRLLLTTLASRAPASAATMPEAPTTPPTTARDVLDFWFAGKYDDEETLSSQEHAKKVVPLWWGAHPTADGFKPLSAEERTQIDAACQPFADLVQRAGRGELSGGDWDTPDGWYAQVLLCDQLSRNCYRGTSEAFKMAPQAQKMVSKLVEGKHHLKWNTPSKYVFLVTVGQHSEVLADHDQGMAIAATMQQRFPGNSQVEAMLAHCEQHRAVVARFGRYPHRNNALGRETTAEEQAWLDDVDNLPGWAKSQMTNKKK
eukprot:m.487767 g.487767  ORF g.487767 m.487767 type:complete len:316 (+) comp25242_c0_seq1:115-1062(+)